MCVRSYAARALAGMAPCGAGTRLQEAGGLALGVSPRSLTQAALLLPAGRRSCSAARRERPWNRSRSKFITAVDRVVGGSQLLKRRLETRHELSVLTRCCHVLVWLLVCLARAAPQRIKNCGWSGADAGDQTGHAIDAVLTKCLCECQNKFRRHLVSFFSTLCVR